MEIEGAEILSSSFFVQKENPRFEQGFRKAYSYESIRQTLF